MGPRSPPIGSPSDHDTRSTLSTLNFEWTVRRRDGKCTHENESCEWMCKVLGFTKEDRKELKDEVEKTALHCSHAIVAARHQKERVSKPLLDVSKWQ